MQPILLFGLETELGIARDGAPNLDTVAESIALVRSATEPGVLMKWDYGCEDPHLDARGFRVAALRQDADEAHYFARDAQRRLTHAEIKSDLVLRNGARFYNDHAHPEYCTPECSTLDELAAHDRAGERIATACARALSEARGATVRLYKNNTDFRGHSYGCHENYLLPRSLPWEDLVRGIQAFLVTRQIYAGAGKFALETEDRFLASGFQISQRADFFSELQSVDTMQRRPIVNTRDEPHANPARWRRFHVILGDANMSPFATRLKVGATALVLEALLREPRQPWPELADPLDALRTISRDPRFRWEIKLHGRRPATALDVQRHYLAAVQARCDLTAPDRARVVADWEAVLADLATDPHRCCDRLDWVAKHALLREFQAAEKLPDDHPWLTSLDLEYHRLDAAAGLYFDLERGGAMRPGPPETEVQRALAEPPRSTRAWVRGRCIQKFGPEVLLAQWDHVTLRGRRGPVPVSLLDVFGPAEIQQLSQRLADAQTPEDLRTRK